MRSMLIAVALFCLSALPVMAQEANTGIHVDVSTSYTKLANGPNAGANATVIAARLPVTGRWSLVYQQYQIPAAAAQIFLGEVEFREPLAHVLRCGACPNAKINLSKIQVYLRAGAGSRRDSVGDNAHAAYGAFGGVAVPVADVAAAKLLFSFEVGFIGSARLKLPGQRFFFLSNAPVIAPGITLRW